MKKRKTVTILNGPAFNRDPEILSGTLCLRGTRMPVRQVASYISEGYSNVGIIEEYPHLTDAQIEAVRAAIVPTEQT